MRRILVIALSLLIMPAIIQAQDPRATFTADFTVQNGQTWGWYVINGTAPTTSPPSGIGSANVQGTELIEVSIPMYSARLYEFEMQYEASLAHNTEVWVTLTDGTSTRIIYRPLLGGGNYTLGDTWANNNFLIDVVELRVVIYNSTILAGTENFHLKRISITHSGTQGGVFTPASSQSIGIDGLYDALSEGAANLDDLPFDLSRPDSVSILPAESGAALFSYVKWIVSPSSADEIAGPFASIISHTGIGLSLVFAIVAIYAIVYVAVFLIRFAIWFFKIVLAVVQIIVGAIGALLNFLPF